MASQQIQTKQSHSLFDLWPLKWLKQSESKEKLQINSPSPVPAFQPLPRAYAALIGLDRHTLLLFGGEAFVSSRTASFQRIFLNDVITMHLDLDTNHGYRVKWKQHTPSGSIPEGRFGANFSAVRGENGLQYYLFGGFVDNHRIRACPPCFNMASMYILEPKTMTWTVLLPCDGSQPENAAGMASCVVNDRYIYYHGGQVTRMENVDDVEVIHSDELHMFDTVTRIWTKCETHGRGPCARSFHSMTNIDNRLLVVHAGWRFRFAIDNAEIYNDLFILDLASMEWRQCIPPPGQVVIPRAGHSACALQNGAILFFGGRSNQARLNDVVIYDVWSNSWRNPPVLGTRPSFRSGQSACMVCSPDSPNEPDKMVIFGGRTNTIVIDDEEVNPILFNDIHLLDLGHYQRDISSLLPEGT